MRIPACLVSLVLVLSACSGTSSDESVIQTSSEQPETSTSAAPSTTDASFDEIQVDPLFDALLVAQPTVVDFDQRFPQSLFDERQECSTDAALLAFDSSELEEMSVEPPVGQIAFDDLNRADSEELAELLADCPGSDEIVRALIQSVSHPRMQDCIESKLLDLNRTPAFTNDLGQGMMVQESSIITGFTYSCSQSVLDETFGEHPGGTLGEDRRLSAQALLEISEVTESVFSFEETCRVRALMSMLPEPWFERVASQLSGGISTQSLTWFLDNETTTNEKDELAAAVDKSMTACSA